MKRGGDMALTIEEQLRQRNTRPGRGTARPRVERLLLILLYHAPCEWLHRTPDGAVLISLGPLAQALFWSISDVLRCLDQMNEQDYLDVLDKAVAKNIALVKPRCPVGMERTNG